MTRLAFALAAAAALVLTGLPDAAALAQPEAASAPVIIQPVRACISSAAAARIDALAAEALATGTPALSVAIRCDDGGFARAYGVANLETGARATPRTEFRLASVTKQFTAAAVLKLAEQGSVRLDDPLSKYVPEMPGAERVTLYQLLTHTSGLADFTEDASYESHRPRDHTSAQLIEWLGPLPPNFAPGTGWRYTNTGYLMLGMIIERVTGLPLQQAYDRLLGPDFALEFDLPGAGEPDERALGYRNREGVTPPVAEPALPISMTIPFTAGALRGTPGELADWAHALFAGRVIGPDSLATMVAPGRLSDGRNSREGMPKEWREGLKADAGMGFFIDQVGGRRRYLHGGDINGFSSWMAYYPDQHLAIAIAVNSESGAMRTTQIEAAVLEGLDL
jgi:CubicO group peptidase (beta-lactamase class C family)